VPRPGPVDLEVRTESIRHVGAAFELVHSVTLGRMPELLGALTDLIGAGTVVPVIDRTYPLEQAGRSDPAPRALLTVTESERG
jgi:NADPH:quinone reductase-like Zn-dependent oxidoreductase